VMRRQSLLSDSLCRVDTEEQSGCTRLTVLCRDNQQLSSFLCILNQKSANSHGFEMMLNRPLHRVSQALASEISAKLAASQTSEAIYELEEVTDNAILANIID